MSLQILRRCYVSIPLMVCTETQAFVCRKFINSVDNLFNDNGITVSLEQAFILLHMDFNAQLSWQLSEFLIISIVY